MGNLLLQYSGKLIKINNFTNFFSFLSFIAANTLYDYNPCYYTQTYNILGRLLKYNKKTPPLSWTWQIQFGFKQEKCKTFLTTINLNKNIHSSYI